MGFWEAVVVAGCGVWLLGAGRGGAGQRAARAAGRATGQAAGVLRAARTRAGALWEEAELGELGAELQAGVRELRDVRQEVGGGLRGEAPSPGLGFGNESGRAAPLATASPAAAPASAPAAAPPYGHALSGVRGGDAGPSAPPDNFVPFSARDIGMGRAAARRGAAGPAPAGSDVFAEAVAEWVLAGRAQAWLRENPAGSEGERRAVERLRREARAGPPPGAPGGGPPPPD